MPTDGALSSPLKTAVMPVTADDLNGLATQSVPIPIARVHAKIIVSERDAQAHVLSVIISVG